TLWRRPRLRSCLVWTAACVAVIARWLPRSSRPRPCESIHRDDTGRVAHGASVLRSATTDWHPACTAGQALRTSSRDLATRTRRDLMNAKLFVGGLSYSTTFDSLREHFGQCGTVKSALVVTDPYSGRSRGFGFVEMSTEDEANTAVTKLNGQMLDGRSLKIESARPRTTSAEAPRSRRPQMAGA